MNGRRHSLLRKMWLALSLTALLCGAALAEPRQPPVIAVIIDDMGNHETWGEAALELPGAVTYAFLPHTPYAASLAEKTHARGRQVMLHLPMDSADGNALGPGALTLHMDESELQQTLTENLQAVPYVEGINNHMGSLLTRHPGAMAWVMEAISARQDQLFFIDSRTTRETVAQAVAQEYRIPSSRRNVFLDNDRDPAAIRAQFSQLLDLARQEGSAVAIGHPYPETVTVLKALLPGLQGNGIRLVRASEMIQLQQRRNSRWQQRSSPWLRVAKSSKP